MGFVKNVVGAITKPVGELLGGTVGDVINPITGQITKSNPYQANAPGIQAQQFSPAISGEMANQQYAIQQQKNIMGQQQGLADTLAQQAAGAGPNPAQEQYKKNLWQALKAQAGAIASNRSLSPALASRLIAQQGGDAIQGQAANAAQLQAEQTLAAQRALAGQQASMLQGGQNLGAQSLQGQDIWQRAIANQNQLGMGAQNINAGIAAQNAQMQNQTNMGILSGLSSAGAAMAGGKAHGGEITSVGSKLKDGGNVPGMAQIEGDSPKNDTVHAMLSPGEIVIPRSLVDDPERAKKFIEQINKKKKGGGYKEVLKAKRGKNA